MRVISVKALRTFWEKHPDCEQALRAWYAEVKGARWTGPADIKRRFPAVSFLPRDRVVFNIKGNRYRLVVVVRFQFGIVYIRFVGTHAEYDRIDASTV